MKTILLKPRFEGMPLHSLYRELVKYPPENYNVVASSDFQKHYLAKIASKHHNYYYKHLLYYFGSLPYVLTQLTQRTEKYSSYDLIYASQHVISTKKPWMVDLEYSNALGGYFDLTMSRNIISKKLKEKSCRAILPWSNWAYETLRNSINCKGFEDKIRVIRYTVTPKNITNLRKDKSSIRILFVGSINPANVNSFEFKGLYEILAAFIDLQKKYDDLELIIRSAVSPEIKEKAKKYSSIRIIENPLSNEELEKLYLTSDIFAHSGFEVLNLSILEAMSYGIPVIATSLYNTPELIKHMHNSILIDLPNPKLFYTKYGTPSDFSKSFLNSMIKLRPYMTQKLVEFMKLLIEDSSLRRKIGKEAYNTIEGGEFSIKNRNKLLKEIFDDATS